MARAPLSDFFLEFYLTKGGSAAPTDLLFCRDIVKAEV